MLSLYEGQKSVSVLCNIKAKIPVLSTGFKQVNDHVISFEAVAAEIK